MAGRIHLVSAGGDGGVFQHTVAVARALSRAGSRVTVHMPERHEDVDLDGLDVCRCVVWGRRKRAFRRPRIAARYLTVTNVHLVRAVRHGDVLHFEGLFRPLLSASTVGLQRLARNPVVHSPHNTFARDGGRVDTVIIRAIARAADASIVFSAHDADAVEHYGGRAVRSPLLQIVPDVEADAVREWRRRWCAADGEPVILFAGQVRADKRLDLVIQSAAGWPEGWRLAVVGPDLGAWERARRLADELAVDVSASLGYHELGAFTAAIAAADVVVCPYDHASQSGILAVARQLGTATVAADVGGLGEYADRVLADPVPERITEAIASVVEGPAGPDVAPDDEAATVAAHREAYAIALRRRSRVTGPSS